MQEVVFEHEIELDLPGERFDPNLFWREVCKIVRHPETFVEAIERAQVKPLGAVDPRMQVLERELSFGNFQVHDRVEIDAERLVVITRVPAQNGIAESGFFMSLSCRDGRHWLSCRYEEDPAVLSEMNPLLHELRTQAWLEKDRAMVRAIQEGLTRK